MTMADLLPDSRPRLVRGARLGADGAYWIPIYCYNCGVAGGSVPEQNMRFVSWLCKECAATYAVAQNELLMPDEVFWELVAQEQMDQFGRPLTEQELVQVVEADATPLAALIKQGGAS
jgi:hypothetical protein